MPETATIVPKKNCAVCNKGLLHTQGAALACFHGLPICQALAPRNMKSD